MTENLNEYYEKNYTQLAATYDETRFGGAKREFSKASKNETVLSFFREFNIPKNAAITDVASGSGRILHCLLKNGYTNINATDLTQAMLDVSEKNIPDGTRQFVHYHCADMKKLPLPDNSADVVTVGKFFYLIPKDEYDNYMVDVKRVLKNNGLLICEISNALHLFNPVTFLKTFFRRNVLGQKIMSYAYPWELGKLFTRFKAERIAGIEFPFFLVKKMSGLETMNRIPLLRSFGGSFVVAYRLIK